MMPARRHELRKLRALIRPGMRRRQGAFLLEGYRSVQTALSYQGHVSMLIVEQKTTTIHNNLQELIVSAEAQGVPVRTVSPEEMSLYSDTVTPPGVMALVRWSPYRPKTAGEALDEIHTHAPRSLLLLDAIADPGNLGTLLRTASGFGVQGVALGKGCVDITNPKVVRSAAGSIFAIPWVAQELDLVDLVAGLQEQGRPLFRAEAGGGHSPRALLERVGKAWALLLGSEAHGLQSGLREFGTAVHLPVQPGTESLNAAVAGGILLYLLSQK
jgi:RNA methyltransferase, TrmH family